MLFTLCLRPQCYNRKNKSPGPWGSVLMMTPPTSGTFLPQQICKSRETLFYWLIPQETIKHANQGDCKPPPLNLIIVNLCLVPAARRKFCLWLTRIVVVYVFMTPAQHMLNGSAAHLCHCAFPHCFWKHCGHSRHKLSLPSKGC